MNFGVRLPRVRMPLIWACAVALVLTVSLLAVRAALHSDPSPARDWRETNDARQLEELYRELSALLHELTLVPQDSAEELARWQAWVELSLRPRIAEFHRRVLAQRAQGPAYRALLHAADRLGAAAANPGNDRLLAAAEAARVSAQSLVREQSAESRSH